jgi:hypothetical protein
MRHDDKLVRAAVLATFENLAKVEVGDGVAGFGISKEQVMSAFRGKMETVPKFDFKHRIYRDRATDNWVVIRPDAQGFYHPFYGAEAKLERLR